MKERSSFDGTALQKVAVKVKMWQMRGGRLFLLKGKTNVASAVMKSIAVPSEKRAATIVYLLSQPLSEMDGVFR